MNIENLISVLIGGSLTLAATLYAHRLQVKHKNIEEDKQLKHFIQGIHDELDTIWGLYMNGVGKQLEGIEQNEGFMYYYPIEQDYFTFYSNNTSMVASSSNEL